MFKSSTVFQSENYKPSIDLAQNMNDIMYMMNLQKSPTNTSLRDLTKAFGNYKKKPKLDTNIDIDKFSNRKSIKGEKNISINNQNINTENENPNRFNLNFCKSYSSDIRCIDNHESPIKKQSFNYQQNDHLKNLNSKSIDKFVKNYKKAHKNTKRSKSNTSLVDLYNNNAENCKFQPELSKRSIKIASRLENSYDRLISVSANKKKKPIERSIDKDLKECSFTPKLNKNSKVIDKKINPNSFSRSDKLFIEAHKLQLYKEKEHLLKLEQECNEQLESCTFYPTKYNGYQPLMSYEGNVEERMDKWSQQVEKRKKKLSQDLLQKEQQSCSFKPKIHS